MGCGPGMVTFSPMRRRRCLTKEQGNGFPERVLLAQRPGVWEGLNWSGAEKQLGWPDGGERGQVADRMEGVRVGG